MANLRLTFPVRGVNKSRVPEGQPEATSPDINNMRPFDVFDERLRGGQRPGLVKWSTDQIGGVDSPIVTICTVSSAE